MSAPLRPRTRGYLYTFYLEATPPRSCWRVSVSVSVSLSSMVTASLLTCGKHLPVSAGGGVFSLCFDSTSRQL